MTTPQQSYARLAEFNLERIQQSEAYQWARAFEAAFTRGDFVEAARLAGERNLLIPTGEVKHGPSS